MNCDSPHRVTVHRRHAPSNVARRAIQGGVWEEVKISLALRAEDLEEVAHLVFDVDRVGDGQMNLEADEVAVAVTQAMDGHRDGAFLHVQPFGDTGIVS